MQKLYYEKTGMIKVIEPQSIVPGENRRIAAIIRHAEREDIPVGEFGNEVQLTGRGINTSVQFGQRFQGIKIHSVYSSPVLRCVQTAVSIIDGYNEPVHIIQNTALGNPGLHIQDDKLAGSHFMMSGFDSIYTSMCRREMLPGFNSVDKFGQEFVKYINLHTMDAGVTMFVTHDLLIMLLENYLYNKYYDTSKRPDFLTGVYIELI